MRSRTGKFILCMCSLLAALPLAAKQAEHATQSEESLFSNTLFNVMLAFIILLLLVIIGMAEMVKAGAAQQLLREKKKKKNSSASITGLMLFLFFASTTLNATSPEAPKISRSADFDYGGMGAMTFFIMSTIILFEVLIAVMLFRSGMTLIKTGVAKAAAKKLRDEPSLLEKLNASVAIEQEESILTDHEYDGIRELDNDLPPWWKYGFYLTIVVSVVYLLHYHVFRTGKLSLEEYEQEMKDGAIALAEYQKNSKDLVDENTVKLLTDAATISEGKAIYKQNCVACHGEFGQGVIGPNFTDNYWLYGGSLKDIFSSIKYGRPKGMKAWKDELGPAKIQAVVSFIKSLQGTNPPGDVRPKEGELYVEDGAKPVSDSVKPVTDSLTITAIDQVKK